MVNRVHDKAGEANAEQGEVILDGPDGVMVSMTPDAARQTGRNLAGAADEAGRQGAELAGKTENPSKP